MGGALHPAIDRAGASFELDRLELDDGRLVVRGWWFGVRGVRFVRPGLVVDGRRVLATLEHKPWAVAEDGGWTAAFPWKRGLDVAGVTLVVAPSVEVPLDRDAEPAIEPLDRGAKPAPVSPAPVTVIEEVPPPSLRDELDGVERQLDAMHAELREARAAAAEREARCRELEHVAARERRAAHDADAADEELVRVHAMAVLDRDRALAQHAEAVNDREAAVRARKRMEAQRDEALAERDAAQARRDEALAERDEVRRQRDELLLAHQALRAQLKREWASEARGTSLPATDADASLATDADASLATDDEASPPTDDVYADARGVPKDGVAPTEPLPALRQPEPDAETPLGVRTIPAARRIAGSLHRAQRERDRDHGLTGFDLWAARILGSVAAVAFIALLAMILKAFFVF